METKEIAVIGAGISGLTCAYELQKAGHNVTVYEKNSHVGGRMSTRLRDSFYFDIGADHLANLYDHMKVYCNEFGIDWEKMRFLQYDIVKNGKLLPLKDAVGFIGKTRLTLEFLKTKNSMDFFDLSTTVEHDNQNAYEYCQQNLGQDVADYLCDPFTSTYQFHRSNQISKGAFKGIMESIKKEKKRWDLHRTKGGMSALPDAFASKLNVNLNIEITEIEKVEEKVIVTEKSGIQHPYDIVVAATTANITKNIITKPSEKVAQLLSKAKYAQSITIAFKVPYKKLPKDVAIVWVPYVESKKVAGFVNEAFKGEQTIKNGSSLICVWLHEDFAKEIINKTDEDIFNLVKKELLDVCPWIENTDISNFDIERWPQAMPIFYDGWISDVTRFMPHNGEDNIFLCGDYLNSPWTEGALRCGQRVSSHILKK